MPTPEPTPEPSNGAPPHQSGHGGLGAHARQVAAGLGKWLNPLVHHPRPLAQANAGPKTSDELSVERTQLSAQRTLMAADRSLMAWIRTALSMISFGFTIYKLLQGFEEAGTHLPNASSPRTMGMFLTGMGTVAMALGTIEYWYRLQELRQQNSFAIWRPSFIMALLMSATGLFMFIAIIAKAL
jgi:putative membrane protein